MIWTGVSMTAGSTPGTPCTTKGTRRSASATPTWWRNASLLAEVLAVVGEDHDAEVLELGRIHRLQDPSELGVGLLDPVEVEPV
jgi:hypothetical protein